MPARPQSISMEWNCLAELDRRITLWRNTIALFHERNRPHFVGPFRMAGYHNYRVEPGLSLRRTGEIKNPDIVASSPSGWLVVDLTCSENSKEEKLDIYKQLEPRSLSHLGLQIHNKPPETLCSRLSDVDDGEHCQILVKDEIIVRKIDCISDEALKTALAECSGTKLTSLPTIPITLLPESKNHEIRRGLVDIVMQIFQPDSKGKTAFQMAEEGLDKLSESVSPAKKRDMINKIKREMDVLINHNLKGYITLRDDGTYVPTDKFREHTMTLGLISSRLKEWANPTQRTISSYDSKTDEDECEPPCDTARDSTTN
jgi:hypothetical protein